MEVLGNNLVWRVLGSYLSPGDLKDCRLVCKTFDENVKQLRKWKEKMQLCLTREMWSTSEFLSLVSGQDEFHDVKVTLSAYSPGETMVIEEISAIFQNVKNLTLQFDQGKRGGFNLEQLGKTVCTILSRSKILESLLLDAQLLAALVDFPTLVEGQPVFVNVKERIRGLKKFGVFNQTGTDLDGNNTPWLKETNFTECMLFMAKHLEKLEDFSLPKTKFEDPFISLHLRGLLEEKALTIQKLELGKIDAIDCLKGIFFPNLTHLSLRVSENSGKSEAKLCGFLSEQMDLQSLTLKIQGYLSKTLLEIIQWKGGNLFALKLKCWAVDDETAVWNFLKSLVKLREFSLTLPSHNRRTLGEPDVFIENIISKLPQQIRKIYFRSGFEGSLTTKYELHSCLDTCNFKDLEELSILLKGPIPIDADEFLTFIGTRGEEGKFPFPKLRKLHFSRSFHDTRKLHGEKEFWAGLDDAYLQQGYGKVTEDSLIEKLSSTNIRHLALPNLNVTQEGIQKIVDSNKSLQTLTSSQFGIQKANRLKTVKFVSSNDEEDSDSDVEPGFGRQSDHALSDDRDDYRGIRSDGSSEDGREDFFHDQSYCGGCHNYGGDGMCQECGDYDYEYDSDFWHRNS